MKNLFDRMLDVIDVDWIEENPMETYELIEGIVHELKARKDVIKLQREELLLLKAMLESK